MWRRRAYCTGKEGYFATQGNKQAWNSEVFKKEKLEENSIYRFKPNGSTALKENSIGVSQSKILIDATIPFQIKPWGYAKWRTNEKVNIGAFHDVKKQYSGGRTTHLYVNNNRNESSNVRLRACWQWCANGCNNSKQFGDLQCIVGRIQPINLCKPFVMSVCGPNNVGRLWNVWTQEWSNNRRSKRTNYWLRVFIADNITA